MRLPFLCEKSGTITLVLQGLAAGWMAGCPAGWLAGRRNSSKFRNFQNYIPDEIFEFRYV